MTQCKTYLLGDLITQRKEKNNNYDVPVLGVSREGFISPKQEEADRRLYNTFYLGDFVFNPARMEVNSIAYNAFYKQAICSSLYEIFYVNRPDILMPEFLNMIVKRDEFARLCAFLGSGSAREYCRVEDISRIELHLPSIEEQRKAVETYATLRAVKEENEALAAPLFQLCQSKIQELKHSMEPVEIGEYIEQSDDRNSDGKYTADDVRGVSIEKKIIDTKANMEGVPVTSYKLFKPTEFCYVPVTSRNGDKITLALNQTDSTYIVSGTYEVFRIRRSSELLPDYLFMWFCRSEFDRLARFNSWGSARESFAFADMKRVRVPIPDIKVQQAIVDIFNCAQKAKLIAEEADKLSWNICPALMQKAINS